MLDQAIMALGGIDAREIIAEALARGDELHNRNRAATSMLQNKLAIDMLECGFPAAKQLRALRFIESNPQFFVGVSLPASLLMLKAARSIPGCSLLTGIGANGKDCGLQVSGTGDRWFVAPADVPAGILMPGFAMADVALACGDSLMVECAGLGASVLPAAPAFSPVIGATAEDAARYASNARSIAIGGHPHCRVPTMGFRGVPIGIDVREGVRTGVLPVIDIMMGHCQPGVGMVGMGLVSPPMKCFQEALIALDQTQARSAGAQYGS
jgi:hypothetical protein